MRSPHASASLALILAGISLLAAGCGGGASPSVASLGDGGTTTTGTTSAGGSGSNLSSGGLSGGQGQVLAIAGGNTLKFSRCMRAHGVPNFPDPNSQGEIQIGPNSGINPGSSSYLAAQQACQRLVGGGKPPSWAETAKARQEALAFSACMRKHGIPDFPDPDFHGGGIGFSLSAQPGSDLNRNNPTFQAAQQTCQGLLPRKPVEKSGSGGGK